MKLFFFTLAALLLPLAALHTADAAKPARPNVLFLFSDDQRFDTIHALGNGYIRTPHLDRLAQSGTVFSNAYIMGGTSGAVCMPSRAMLMSGRTLFRIENNLKGQTTWPEKFGQAGYSTFLLKDWQQKLGDTQPLTTDKPQSLTFDFSKVKVRTRPKSGME